MDKEFKISTLKARYRTIDISWETYIWVIFWGLLLVIGLLTLDLISDYFKWFNFSHFIAEISAIVCLLSLIIYLIILLTRTRIAALDWKTRANRAEGEAQKWQEESQEILKGLGYAIDQQFEKWKLSKGEKEIGLFLLKGFSFKEIADFRSVSERTVRQQATTIYKKSDLGSRSEFAAFFLEDLLLPIDPSS